MTKLVPLSGGKAFAAVDDADFEGLMAYRWQLHPRGYAQRMTPRVKGEPRRVVLMHVSATPDLFPEAKRGIPCEACNP